MTETIVVPFERAGLELDEFLCLHFPEFNKGFLRRAVRAGPDPARRHAREPFAAPARRPGADRRSRRPGAADRAGRAGGGAADPLRGRGPARGRQARGARGRAGALGARRGFLRGRAAGPGARAQPGADGGGEEAAPLELRLRAVHRLDKNTTGALVVAKHLEAERALRGAFEEDRVHKTYLALVEGEHPLGDGEEEEIDLALGPDEKRSGRMVVDPAGKPARTRIAVEQRFRGFTWLVCRPLTGRTHQIRVHLSATGFPLAVDPVYGRRNELLLSNVKAGYRAKRGRPERPLISRLTLHAAAIELPSPRVDARDDPGRGAAARGT